MCWSMNIYNIHLWYVWWYVWCIQVLAGSWGRPFLSKIPRKNIMLIDDYDHHFVKKKKGKKTKGTMKIIWKSSPVCRGLQNSKLLKGLTADSDKLSSLLYSSCFTLSHSIKSLSMLWSHPRRNDSPCNQVVARLPKSSVIQLSSSITKLPTVYGQTVDRLF